MTVASALTPQEMNPSEATEVWEPVTIPCPDWSEGVQVTTRWQSSVSVADSGAETRRLLLTQPLRSVSFNPLSFSEGQSRLLQIFQERSGRARALVPLWSDFTLLTSDVSAGGDQLGCDTTYRRLVPGARVAVFEDESALAAPGNYELGVIADVLQGIIELDAPLTGDWPAGSYVVPLMECEPSLTWGGRWITAQYMGTGISAEEVAGESSLGASVDEGQWPVGVQLFNGEPIWPWYENMGQGVLLQGESFGALHEVGTGMVPSSTGALPVQTWEFEVGFHRRKDWAEWVEFFDAARGRLRPFWMLNPGNDLELVLVPSANQIVVKASGPESDWQTRTHIGLDLKNGTQRVAGIASVVRTTGQDTINLTDAIPGVTLGDVVRCCIARKVRLAEDTASEQWLTDQAVNVRFSIMEVRNEAVVDAGWTSPWVGPTATVPADPCAPFVREPGIDAFWHGRPQNQPPTAGNRIYRNIIMGIAEGRRLDNSIEFNELYTIENWTANASPSIPLNYSSFGKAVWLQEGVSYLVTVTDTSSSANFVSNTMSIEVWAISDDGAATYVTVMDPVTVPYVGFQGMDVVHLPDTEQVILMPQLVENFALNNRPDNLWSHTMFVMPQHLGLNRQEKLTPFNAAGASASLRAHCHAVAPNGTVISGYATSSQGYWALNDPPHVGANISFVGAASRYMDIIYDRTFGQFFRVNGLRVSPRGLVIERDLGPFGWEDITPADWYHDQNLDLGFRMANNGNGGIMVLCVQEFLFDPRIFALYTEDGGETWQKGPLQALGSTQAFSQTASPYEWQLSWSPRARAWILKVGDVSNIQHIWVTTTNGLSSPVQPTWSRLVELESLDNPGPLSWITPRYELPI